MSTAVSRRLRRRRLFAECSVLVNPVCWVQASRAISNGRIIIIIVALKAVPTVCLFGLRVSEKLNQK